MAQWKVPKIESVTPRPWATGTVKAAGVIFGVISVSHLTNALGYTDIY